MSQDPTVAEVLTTVIGLLSDLHLLVFLAAAAVIAIASALYRRVRR